MQAEQIVWDQAPDRKIQLQWSALHLLSHCAEFNEGFGYPDFVQAAGQYPARNLSLYVHIPLLSQALLLLRLQQGHYPAPAQGRSIPSTTSNGRSRPRPPVQGETGHPVALGWRHTHLSERTPDSSPDGHVAGALPLRRGGGDQHRGGSPRDRIVHAGCVAGARFQLHQPWRSGTSTRRSRSRSIGSRTTTSSAPCWFVPASWGSAPPIWISSTVCRTQNRESFHHTLEEVLKTDPARLSIFNYAHLPSRFAAQHKLKEADMPAPQEKLAMLQDTIAFPDRPGLSVHRHGPLCQAR